MATVKITKKNTSVAIIGGGLSGLTLAACLEKQGIDYLLIESKDTVGGFVAGHDYENISLDFGLKSVPAGEIARNPLMILKEKLQLGFSIESWSEEPQTLNKQDWNSFLGFGSATSKNKAVIENLSYYTSSPRLAVSGGWQKLINELNAIIPENKKRLRSEVTTMKITDGKVSSMMVNGDTEVVARYFIYTLSPGMLSSFLPPGTLNAKTLQKITRTEPVTAISLDLISQALPNCPKNILVLQEGQENPTYMIGQFVNAMDPVRTIHGKTISTWMTFITAEQALVDEEVSQGVKAMKRLLKRAFPLLLENAPWERIIVAPEAMGQYDQLPLDKALNLSGITNLLMCGGQTPSHHQHTLAAISSAMNISDELLTASKTVAPEIRTQETSSEL